MARRGIRVFWGADDRQTPRLRWAEAGPVSALIAVCVLLAVFADPVIAYLNGAAADLDEPHRYISAVMDTPSGRTTLQGAHQ